MPELTTAQIASPLDPISDEEIVARVVAGETVLFELLMRRHNQRVYRTVRAILGADQEAEDVMQQTYLNAYSHLASFAGQARFTTWLTSIAVNESLGRRRRAGAAALRIVDSDEDPILHLRATGPDPEQQVMTSELQHLLEEEIMSLPEHYRTVLVMRQVEGLSTEETAECLSVSSDVVKTRLRRARVMLREALLERAGVTFDTLFAFQAPRCDRVVAAVMSKIS
ncbi:MAG TPA: RNA polymerase sigma factor [Thermoanaerobaculia bacterium]|nr:RNA polymerase sigma factor [Thermoanaerobaculia bacterium]